MAKATCHLTALGDSKVQGFIAFTQKTEDTPTAIIGEIVGLTPGPHAISIQIFGDLSQGFASMGGHFNPFGRNHGEPGDEERHVGSLGNINADVEGRAKFAIEDKLVKLIGPYVRDVVVVGSPACRVPIPFHAGTTPLPVLPVRRRLLPIYLSVNCCLFAAFGEHLHLHCRASVRAGGALAHVLANGGALAMHFRPFGISYRCLVPMLLGTARRCAECGFAAFVDAA